MKAIKYLILLISISSIYGQDYNLSFVKETIYKKPTTSSTIDLDNPVDVNTTITYINGKSNPTQTIFYKQSNSNKNIIKHYEYDNIGRQTKDFLPYSKWYGNQGLEFDSNASNDVEYYYSSSGPADNGNPNFDFTDYPYSNTEFDSSPLNRVLKSNAPGNAWHNGSGREIKYDYAFNTATDRVRIFQVTTTWNPTDEKYVPTLTQNGGFFGANLLYKNIIKNENWTIANGQNNTEEHFIDKNGQTILKRTFNNNIAHDTYFLYDSLGNLSIVIAPNVITVNSNLTPRTITTADLNNLCYRYIYDYKNRLIEKKLPGRDWQYILYDKFDRVRATGPHLSTFTNHPSSQQGWLFTKYDLFNRPVMTGFVPASVTMANRKTLQASFNNATSNFNEQKSTGIPTIYSGVTHKYTDVSWPISNNVVHQILTVNYYDNYDFPNAPSPVPTQLAELNNEPTLNGANGNTKTLPTASYTRVCTTTTLGSGETTYTLYDLKARPIANYSTNHLGGYTHTFSKLDFIGQVQYTIQKHKRLSTSNEINVREDFTYSDQGRLVTHTHQINGNTPEVLSRHEYDELGQLITKKVGGNGTNYLQKVDLSYNIRGWLKQINNIDNLNINNENDLFAFKINYNDPDPLFAGAATFNGNISQTFWRSNHDNTLKRYGYSYDHLNRLLHAQYTAGNMPSHTNNYNETISYDKNGNIQTMFRRGSVNNFNHVVDDLTYGYSGNQLLFANENPNSNGFGGFVDGATGSHTSPEYSYDNFGNMTRDNNKKILSIRYNHLNLPTTISFQMFSSATIGYTYNANGSKVGKLQTTVNNGITTSNQTDYLGGFQYLNGVLQFIPHAQGYVRSNSTTPMPTTFDYVYQYKDHLGNIRINYTFDTATSSLIVLDRTEYYPFGMTYSQSLLNNKYKFNEKEWQDEFSFNVFDFGARNYDPAIGRWMNIDPMAEYAFDWTPYRYGFNNPMRYIDPDGMYEEEFPEGDGTWVGQPWSDLDGSWTWTGSIWQADPFCNCHDVLAEIKIGPQSAFDKDEFLNSQEDNEDYYENDLRFPDYYNLNISIAIPNPYTLTFVGWNGSFSIDRHGQVFGSILGFSVGKSASFVSGSATANWINQSITPTAIQTSSFLTGHGINVTAGYGLGASWSNSPTNSGSNNAFGVGVVSPQIGASYNYTH
jgi:RHS repeat-associated protein